LENSLVEANERNRQLDKQLSTFTSKKCKGV
jgi:hypothetical protein